MNTQIMDTAFRAAEKIKQIGESAKQSFIERDDFIDAFVTALCCGEHMIVLGKPGTSKTAIGKYFAQAMGLMFFYKQGNPDLLRDDFEGPIDAHELSKNNKWDRAWSGLAVADFGFVDEIGRASGQVQDLLLEMMEERSTSIANTIHPIPLHTLISGSNSTIHHHAALWDRFSLRCFVEYVKNTGSWLDMLYTDLTPPSISVSRDELQALRCASSYIAMQRNPDVDQKLVLIKQYLSTDLQCQISDRRWRRCLKVAAGSALLRGGEQNLVSDLYSSRWLLWDTLDQIEKVYRFIEEQCNVEAREIREFRELVNEIETEVNSLTAGGVSEGIAKVGYKITKLQKQLKSRVGPNWTELTTKLQRMEEVVDQLI